MRYCNQLHELDHLTKLDIVQKKAARVIYGIPHTTHAAPLLESLKLEPLENRRRAHILKLVTSMIEGVCHPAFTDFFQMTDGRINVEYKPRLKTGAKGFTVIASDIYNDSVTTQDSVS